MGHLFRRGALALLAVIGFATAAIALPAAPGPGTVGVAGAAPLIPPGIGSVPDLSSPTYGWQRVFEDNFNGTSLDESVWSIREKAGASGPGWRTRESVTVANGELTLRAFTRDGEHHTGEIATGAGGGTDGAFQANFMTTYGYIEARVKLKTESGNAHAFWMLANTSTNDPFDDPASAGPELDIFEHADPVNGDVRNNTDPLILQPDGRCDYRPDSVVPCNQLVQAGKHVDGFEEFHWTDVDTAAGNPNPSVPLEGNYHEYGMLWTPEGYRIYLDGHEIYRSTEAITFRPEYLLLTQHAGGFGGVPTPAGGYGALGAASNPTMVVDWVKVWQRPVSDIPDRTIAPNASVSIPFAVTDRSTTSSNTTIVPAPPRSVRARVTASSNTTLLPTDRAVVTGNGPSDPNGDFENGGFESGLAEWDTSGTAALATSGPRRTGTGSLRFAQAGGRAEQIIRGLAPNTTYMVGAWHNITQEWSDTNGDGAIGPGEGDPLAAFDWGIVDVDGSTAGEQQVRARRERHAFRELDRWHPRVDGWRHDSISFTTGPNTTQVTLFVENTSYVSAPPPLTDFDSEFWIDDVYVHALVSPNRTVTLRPADNATGSSIVTVSAWVDTDDDGTVDTGETVLGTDQFTVTVQGGSSFTNGDFESAPVGAGWELLDGATGRGAEIVAHDPFKLNRALELSGPAVTQTGMPATPAQRAAGTAFQRVTNLAPNTAYRLDVRGRGTGLQFRFEGMLVDATHPDPCQPASQCTIDSSNWTTDHITFTTDSSGTGRVVLLDWEPNESGPSLVDDVRLTTTATPAPPPVVSPALTSLNNTEQRLVSSGPRALNFSLPNSQTTTRVTSVTSNNQMLLPDRNLAASSGVQHKVLSLTPVPERTGVATVTVGWQLNGAAQPAVSFRVVVSESALANPGFELGAGGWAPDGGFVTTGPRSGSSALQIAPGASVTQHVTGLTYSTAYALDGWVRGGGLNVSVEFQYDYVNPANRVSLASNVPWSGGTSWTSNRLRFTHQQCAGCVLDLRPVRITLANPGTSPVFVDDLALLHAPMASNPREFSFHRQQTTPHWVAESTVLAGKVPYGAFWNPAMFSYTTTDRVPGGAGAPEVLSEANMRSYMRQPTRPGAWTITGHAAPTGQRTGYSDVRVTLTDPLTGLSTQRSFTATVNAGNNFNAGDFEHDNSGWTPAWGFYEQGWGVVPRRANAGHQQLPLNVPFDSDKVMRISSGITGYRITGLTPGTRYVVQARAIGNGSRIVARNYDAGDCTDAHPADPTGNTPNLATGCVIHWGSSAGTGSTPSGEVRVSSTSWTATPNLFLTPRADNTATPWINESDVWIFVHDDHDDSGSDDPNDPDTMNEPIPANPTPCFDDDGTGTADTLNGETCIDEIGVFVATDVAL